MTGKEHRWQGATLNARYLLGPPRGQGGMGDVLEAVDLTTRSRVAVKVLRPELAKETEYLERFRREAEIASWLEHPSIVHVYDMGRDRDANYLVMELLEGESLGELMARDGALTIGRLLELMRQTLSALEAAHAAGIVHRDLKPANLIVVRDPQAGERVKLVDFGIAKLRESKGFARLTATGVLIGTPRYTAPEQLEGAQADERADIYALGVLLYQALGGRHPFEAPTDAEIVTRMVQDDRAPIGAMRPDLPAAVRELVETAMARLPEHRFQTARAMRLALEQAADAAQLAQKTPSSPPDATETRAARRTPSRPGMRQPQTTLPHGTVDPAADEQPTPREQ